VAIDVARTARRLGSEDVRLVCLETRDASSQDRMPALDWEIAEAEEEGIVIHSSLGIREILVEAGKAVGVRTRKCISVREPDGSFNPQYDDTVELPDLQGDSIVLAVGQANDHSLEQQGQGIFAGGDMADGPSTVIQAVASARNAARSIETFLNGGQPTAEVALSEPEYAESSFDPIPRAQSHELPAAERLRHLDQEDNPGLGRAGMENEAKRCVSCGCLAVGPSDLAIALVTLDAVVVTNKRSVGAQAFFKASAASSTILEPEELIKEIVIPKTSERGASEL